MKLPDGVPSAVRRAILTPEACQEIQRRFWTGRLVFDEGFKRHWGDGSVADAFLPPDLAAAPHFMAGYVATENAILTRHNDGHDGCTLSVVISAEGAPASSWPIIVEGNPAALEVGDGLLYRARLDHWRDPKPAGLARYVVMMFAFLADRQDRVRP